MANEAVIIELLGNGGDPLRYTVADGTGIAKGTIMKFSSDPRTIAAATADGDLIAGIAASEKVANDGSTELAVYTNGVFDIMCTAGTGSAVLGGPVKVTGANTIAPADDDGVAKAREVVGYSLETGSASEVVAVRVLI